MENNPDASDKIQNIISDVESNLPDAPSEDLSGLVKLLKDLLNTLAAKDGKKVTVVLDNMAQQHPDLSGLIDGLKKLMDALQKGEKVDMGAFKDKVNELFNQLKKKGTASSIRS